MRAGEAFQALTNQTGVTSATFFLTGGKYVLDVIATGAGSVTVQRLGPDGATQIATALTLTASGAVTGDLPPGSYTVVTTGLTAVYARITRVPEE
jgi:hypothetical protein